MATGVTSVSCRLVMEYKKLPVEVRESRARQVLEANYAPSSTVVHNVLAERFQSRRNRVRQNDDDQTARKNKIRMRLMFKLAMKKMAAHKENLEREQNERQTTKEDAKNSGSRPSKKKGKSRKKAPSQKKKMRPKVKNALPQEKGPRTQKSHP